MPDTRHPIDMLIDTTLESLDTDSDARDVLLEKRLVSELDKRELESNSTNAKPAKRPRIRLRAGVGAALAGATALILVVALGPGGSPSGPSHLPSPDSAEAALRQAGESAAGADWTPLGDNDYFHVATTSFAPEIPNLKDENDSMFLGGVRAGESWLGRDGHGKMVTMDGGSGDPTKYPSLSRDRKTGKVVGIGSRMPKPGEQVDVEAALKYPDSVNVMAWPRQDQAPYQRAWVRTRSGFLQIADMVMTERTMGQEQTPENTMKQFWSTSIEAIDAANANDDPDGAARTLIEQYVDDPQRAPGMGIGGEMNGEKPVKIDDDVLDREAGIEHAVQLLGTAPLTPDVRRALYRWLASQPGAAVRPDATDELGRSGTEVTFESIREDPIPTYTVTAAEILKPFLRGPQTIPGTDEIDRDTVYTVKNNVQRRRWRVSFIVNVQSGELLQQYFYFRQGREGKRPVFTTWATGPRIDMRDPGGGAGGGGAQLFTARERVTAIEPLAAACEAHPQVCR